MKRANFYAKYPYLWQKLDNSGRDQQSQMDDYWISKLLRCSCQYLYWHNDQVVERARHNNTWSSHTTLQDFNETTFLFKMWELALGSSRNWGIFQHFPILHASYMSHVTCINQDIIGHRVSNWGGTKYYGSHSPTPFEVSPPSKSSPLIGPASPKNLFFHCVG